MSVGNGDLAHSSAGDLAWPLRRAARLHGDWKAVVDGAQSVTYAELSRRVAALGAAIAGLEVAPGGRVGFLGENSLAHMECLFGLPASGRVLVDLNFRLTEAELAYMADECALEVLICDARRLDVGRSLRAHCSSLRHLVLDASGRCPEDCLAYEALTHHAPAPERDIDEHALAVISYTGGTTGSPKGVMLSHSNLLANARHNLIATGHSHDDRWLHTCPMFHVAGTANVLACTWVGCSQVIVPRFEPRVVIDTIRTTSVTHTVLVPTMLATLLDELDADGGGLPSVRHIQYAGSPISPALQARLLERFDCDVAQFYGMTETAPTVTHLSPADHRRGMSGKKPHISRLRTVGTPVAGVEVDIRGPNGEPVPIGEIGEICVRGPNVMLGYWNRPDATTAALAGGWYHSGDAARVDEDGYVYIVDRFKDMIITGGENVYSTEVEAALLEHAAVNEAAVFGIPDGHWGEAVHAIVSLSPGAGVTAQELIAHCRNQIAGYKVPRSIELRTEPLPKSGAGKLLKHVLRKPFWAGQERQVN